MRVDRLPGRLSEDVDASMSVDVGVSRQGGGRYPGAIESSEIADVGMTRPRGRRCRSSLFTCPGFANLSYTIGAIAFRLLCSRRSPFYDWDRVQRLEGENGQGGNHCGDDANRGPTSAGSLRW